MGDIFLSYARDDAATARRFADAFEAQGFSVWWDAALRSGETWDQEIEKALKTAKAVVVLWSKQSVDSRWVRAEATLADRNQTLVPAMIESCDRPLIFELTHTADLSHWSGDRKDTVWQSYVADVRRLVEKGAPEGTAVPSARLPRTRAAARPWYRRRNAMIAIPSLVILSVAGLCYALLHPATPAVGTHAAIVASQAAPAGVSLAVLPFADMSPQHDQDYFSDGLSEELLDQLAQIKDLKVAGRTSSFSFKGRNEDLRVIGAKLGVNHLLEGSVRKDGNQLRITAQLINAADGSHLWSQTYDRKLQNVFAVQEEIAKDVAGALSIELGVGQTTAVAGGTSNVEAYDKFLRARALANQFEPVRAIPLYRAALALDPKFVQGWVGLAEALSAAEQFTPEKSGELRKETLDAASRVLALAPQSWWAQFIRAWSFVDQLKWAQAQAALDAAIAAAPASDVARDTMCADFLSLVGRVKEATACYERARLLDPLSLDLSTALQWSLFASGRTADSLAEYERGKDLAGDHQAPEDTALRALWFSKSADSSAKAQYGQWLGQTTAPRAIGRALADKLDDPVAARAVLRQAFADPVNQDFLHMAIISRFADHFGDEDLALEALRRLVVNRLWIRDLWWPRETGLRADPRFKQLLRDLKLADYFRATGRWGDFCHPVGKDDFECR